MDNMIFYSQDFIFVILENVGIFSYIFIVENDFGCIFDIIVNIQVLFIMYLDCYSCGILDSLLIDMVICEGESVVFDVILFFVGMVLIIFE